MPFCTGFARVHIAVGIGSRNPYVKLVGEEVVRTNHPSPSLGVIAQVSMLTALMRPLSKYVAPDVEPFFAIHIFEFSTSVVSSTGGIEQIVHEMMRDPSGDAEYTPLLGN